MASLTPREQDRIMNELVAKLRQERLERDEALELRGMLEEKKTEALDVGNLVVAAGMIFLLAGLIGYLAEKFHLF